MTTSEPSSPARPSLLISEPGERWRLLRSRLWETACLVSTVIVLIPLGSLLLYVVKRGFDGLSLTFFTALPKPVGELGGGLGNSIAGSLTLIAIACAMGLPIGIGAGVYLAEVGRGRFASAVRFVTDVLGGVPSISVGVFIYSFVVIAMRRFSALAGGMALAIVMLPTVTRTTEELLKLVPGHLREAALGLGVPAWRTSVFVVLRTALPGIGTGVMLAVARISGETAALLFTAFNSRFWMSGLDRPIASLPVQVLTYATSPYKDWQQQAWTGALVLVCIILLLNLTARFAASRGRAKR